MVRRSPKPVRHRDPGEFFFFYFERWRGSRQVQRMTFAERGVFLEMLIEQWIRGDLPDDPRTVADAIATSTAHVGEVEAAWPAVRRQFDLVDTDSTRIHNRVLARVWKERQAWVRQRK